MPASRSQPTQRIPELLAGSRRTQKERNRFTLETVTGAVLTQDKRGNADEADDANALAAPIHGAVRSVASPDAISTACDGNQMSSFAMAAPCASTRASTPRAAMNSSLR